MGHFSGKIMDYLLFIQAAIIGLSIAAPVGPIGVLCMQRTLQNGVKVGLACGLGAATADGIYGAIGVFGLTAVIQLFTSLAKPMAVCGGGFLLWMGFRLLTTKEVADKAAVLAFGSGIVSAFISTMLLTLANPMTILSFVAVFSALSGAVVVDGGAAATMVFGVFAGSSLWWLMLSMAVSVVRHKIDGKALRGISKAAGLVLVLFGGWQINNVLM